MKTLSVVLSAVLLGVSAGALADRATNPSIPGTQQLADGMSYVINSGKEMTRKGMDMTKKGMDMTKKGIHEGNRKLARDGRELTREGKKLTRQGERNVRRAERKTRRFTHDTLHAGKKATTATVDNTLNLLQ